MPTLSIKFLKCNKLTESIEPVIIRKLSNDKYKITIDCAICKKPKNRTLNKFQMQLLPEEIKNASDNSVFANTIEKNGKALPIIPLIGAIAAGITALSGVAGNVASNIIQAKKNDKEAAEIERHNKEIEKLASGDRVPLERSGKGIDEDDTKETKDIDDAKVRKYIKKLNGFGFIFL